MPLSFGSKVREMLKKESKRCSTQRIMEHNKSWLKYNSLRAKKKSRKQSRKQKDRPRTTNARHLSTYKRVERGMIMTCTRMHTTTATTHAAPSHPLKLHNLTSPSSDPLTILSSPNARQVTAPRCPTSVAVHLPSSLFHTLIVRS